MSVCLGSPRKLGNVWVQSVTLQVAWLSRVQAITQGRACACLLQLKISARTVQHTEAERAGARLTGESTCGRVSVAQRGTRLQFRNPFICYNYFFPSKGIPLERGWTKDLFPSCAWIACFLCRWHSSRDSQQLTSSGLLLGF